MPRYFLPSPDPKSVTILGRPTCYTCFRPVSHCVCGFVEPFRAHFNTVILQHPNERRKYYSTTKLVSGAIQNSRILRGVEFDASALESLLEGQSTYLLYPRAGAIDASEARLDCSCTVVVIDGTWREAAKIIFRNEFLKKLPCLTFKREMQSNYKIRKQPKPGCLSTLESLGALLKINAEVMGHDALLPAYDSLFAGFDRMVAQQLRYWPSRREVETQKIA